MPARELNGVRKLGTPSVSQATEAALRSVDLHPQTSHAHHTTHEAAGPTGSHGSAAAAGDGCHQSLNAARLHLDQHHRHRHLHHRRRCLHHLRHRRHYLHLRHYLRLLHLLHCFPRCPLHHPCLPLGADAAPTSSVPTRS
ncbi:unnamed protein product [Closterium sp. NIES-54]